MATAPLSLKPVISQTLDAHSHVRQFAEGKECGGSKAGDALLTALPIDDRRGWARQAGRRVLLGNPFEGCHAFRPGDWIDDRHRRAAADVCKTEKIIPEVALVLNFAAFMIEDRVKGEKIGRAHV